MPSRISYELLAPVKVLRKELGLTPNDIAVLTALISFLPRDKAETALTIVFPSNEALSERCNGLDERTLRRCIARLVEAGLIARKTSANRKRFPLRFGGVIRDAFGFDLQPLALHHAALQERANRASEAQRDLQSLRSRALALRAEASHRQDLSPEQIALLSAARNVLRRATLTREETEAVMAQIEAVLGQGASEPEDLTATNGQNVRHIESLRKEFKTHATTGEDSLPLAGKATMKADPNRMTWQDFEHVASFFPEEPRTAAALNRTLFDLGQLLRIAESKITQALRSCDPGRILLAFNYLLANVEKIRHPGAYLDRILAA